MLRNCCGSLPVAATFGGEGRMVLKVPELTTTKADRVVGG